MLLGGNSSWRVPRPLAKDNTWFVPPASPRSDLWLFYIHHVSDVWLPVCAWQTGKSMHRNTLAKKGSLQMASPD